MKLPLNLIKIVFSIFLICFSITSFSGGANVTSESEPLSREQQINAAEKEMEKLERLLEQNTKMFNERPRRAFVGAKAKNYQVALYVENWRQKMEKVGNENYPKAATAEHLYGEVRATVSIMSDGTVEAVNINKSSGYQLLDDSVIEIVKKAAPYEKFSDELKKDCDIISITRTWTFTQEDVETESDVPTKPAKDDIGDK